MEKFCSFDEKIRRFSLWDIKLLQGAAIFVGLIIVRLLEPVLNIYRINILWFILFAVVFSIKPLYVVFKTK